MCASKTLPPKIWFRAVTDRQENSGDRDCDCDCDCACSVSVGNPAELEETHFQRARTDLYHQTASLHWQECGEDRWLAFNPNGAGKVTVLNQSAAFLFGLFQSPTSLAQAVQAVSKMSPDTIGATVAQLVRLGLLEKIGTTAAVLHWREPNTLTTWLHITNECNLCCPYCYLRKTHDDMSDDIARWAVDAIFRSAKRHHFDRVKLKYSGGEASLRIRQVLVTHDYAVTLAQEHNIELEAVILSNGVALSQHMIDELVARRIKVMVSLDGIGGYHDAQRPFPNGKGSFQEVHRTIERLLVTGSTPHISITVSDYNLDGLPSLIEYVLAHNLPFSLNYYRENECSTEITDLRFGEARMIETMRVAFAVIEQNLPRQSLLGCLVDRANLNAPHKKTCGVGHNYMVIDSKGGVAKCQMEIGQTVTTVDAEDPLQFIRDDRQGIQTLSVDEKEGCQTCEWRYWCTGGCSLVAYRATGRYDVKSPHCNIYRALYPEVLRLEALRLLQYEMPWTPQVVNS